MSEKALLKKGKNDWSKKCLILLLVKFMQIFWIKWYFLDLDTGRYEQRKEVLYINSVGRDDEGLYRCRATNKFPSSNNEEEEVFTSVLDQQLRISSKFFLVIVKERLGMENDIVDLFDCFQILLDGFYH